MEGAAAGRVKLYADLGNTTLHMGIWLDGWVGARRVAMRDLQGPEAWREALSRFARECGLPDGECGGALGCASTKLRGPLAQAVREVFGVSLRLLGQDLVAPMAAEYDDPASIGQDRLLGGFAAWRAAGGPCIVLDAGTCVTCDVVAEEGILIPIAIAPGLPAMRRGVELLAPHLGEALAASPAQELPTESGPARSTRQSIAAGLAHALGGCAQRLIGAARSVLPQDAPAQVILTGGDASLLASLLAEPARLAPMLNLDGLRQIDELGGQ